ncbi:valine--tRNA ligase [Blochmannia endosymbiont of Colobopsis nipponica]|uniref:valine--tRNA ligase n=1 Tax=Blochmannia endosymbiont of Colobopsis nipponica TaxID=2681987 RepID=UPI00177F50CD|nr:valine--tRNA ligase [Blochmannia endosymbiont of Colobopsis nipponica]QOI11329.1 valine--tRNA ligase [Blochmannia endosymbiont of Colobopsis nipponica]
MNKKYNPQNIEQPLYKLWEKRKYFSFNNDNLRKENYCIMIPPPNITGTLHLGHALQYSIIDILIRYKRMSGNNTLWQTGTDHAGIATEIIVENKTFLEEGKTRLEYKKEEFIKKIWKWQQQSTTTINNQMRRLGNSVDWERERFTMDAEMSNAVREVFIQLYQENLIYRGKKLVNWDSKLQTVISDLEIENKKTQGLMWYICYPLANKESTEKNVDYIVVATTRPETILGDTAIAVNPMDERYKNLVGKYVTIPIINDKIPIITDEIIDMQQGTGCVKITPAHNFNDHTIALKHKLPMINIFTNNGCICQKAEIFEYEGNTNKNLTNRKIPKYLQGLTKNEARKKIIEKIIELKLLKTTKPHESIIPYSERSGIIIEPMLTNQWYIRAKNLAHTAIQAVKVGKINFLPKKYEKVYFDWMYNIQDWCISRQIWWGHTIPAWYDNFGNVYVGRNEREIRNKFKFDKNINLTQDEDVLDTWFSSSLWTFAALGWPKNNSLLQACHPTNIIISGFDIIFFWIARMIMLTMYIIKDEYGTPQIPFKTIYITGLVRDEIGQKMSKSKGNVIDPLDIIDGISISNLIKKRTTNMLQPKITKKIKDLTKKKFPYGIKAYGADALRFTMAALSSTGRDIIWDMQRLEGYRNFCNKIWNASRFVIINTENQDCGFNGSHKKFSLVDRWISTKFNQTVKAFREQLDKCRFDHAANILHEFAWHQFCDWYLEFTKTILNQGSIEELCGTRYTLITILESLLRLAHPIIPFITEAIWQKIIKIIRNKKNNNKEEDSIMIQPFPKFDASILDFKALSDIDWIRDIITEIRTIKNNFKISTQKSLSIIMRYKSIEAKNKIIDNLQFILNMINLNNITLLTANEHNPPSLSFVVKQDLDILVPIELFDKQTELIRLNKDIANLEKKILNTMNKLNNKNYISNAPKNIILKEKEKLKNYQEKKIQIIKQKTLILT